MKITLAIVKCDDGTYTVVAPIPAMVAEARKRSTRILTVDGAIEFANRQYGITFGQVDTLPQNVTVIEGVSP